MKKKAIYTGTFDPITNGHIDILTRGLKIFDEIIIAIGINDTKQPMFDIDKRVNMIKETIKNLNNVSVLTFDTLLVDFAKKQGINNIIRGLRAFSDFEYELQMGYANNSLNKDLETIYLMPALNNAFISSSVVRELIKHNGKIEHLVPNEIIKLIKDYK